MIKLECLIKKAGKMADAACRKAEDVRDAAAGLCRGLEKMRSRYNEGNSLRWTIRGDFTQFWNRRDDPDTRFADSTHHCDFSLSLVDLALLAAGFVFLSALIRLLRR